MKQQINNNSGIDNVKFKFSYLGKYVETNLGNKGIIVEEYLCYPEPCEWVLDNGYILNEALMYEENEEFVVIKDLKENDLNMKSARELFEELGYKLVYKKNSSITNITYVKELSKIKRRNRKKAIIFNKYKNEPIDITIDIFLQYKDKKITHWQSGINEQELQAINQQVNELGGE